MVAQKYKALDSGIGLNSFMASKMKYHSPEIKYWIYTMNCKIPQTNINPRNIFENEVVHEKVLLHEKVFIFLVIYL